MTHEKLVAGTESPTRYTKIIRNPGAGTKYNRTYQETGYVSRYTKLVAGGKDYVPPAPPEPEYDPLAVADGQGANWLGSNVYEVGQTLEAKTAAWTGGLEPVTYRYRFQFKEQSEDGWVSGAWTNTTNAKNTATYVASKPGQVKFQSQAKDSSTYQAKEALFSNTSTKDIPFLEFGDLSVIVNDIAYDTTVAAPLTVLMNDPLPAVVSITGNATPTYVWTARGDYPIMVGQQAASTVLTFPTAGAVTVTCTLTDPNTEEYNTSVVINFFVVDAKEFEELKNKGEI